MGTHLEIDEIAGYEYVDCPKVYDITVNKNHNYYLDCGHPILVHNSSKTFSIIQSLILYCLYNNGKGKVITISRQKLTWIKATILQDFKFILKLYGIYTDKDFNKTDMIYRLFGNEIWFIGLDEEQKLHGRKQNIFWINEANEATKGDFDQLEMRTTEFFILDYNPNFTEHWILSNVLTRNDVDYNHSTMLDNPFLEQKIINKIKSYEPTEWNIKQGTADENKWKIYGLGERANIEGQIYTKYKFVSEFPPNLNTWVWLDFGFTNDPTAMGRMGLMSGEIYMDEFCYKTGLTNPDISAELTANGIHKTTPIIADSAEAKSIAELRRMGWNVLPAKKGPDSIKNGIDILQRYNMNVTERSLNLKMELGNYTWIKDRSTGGFTNTPVDNFNHHLDGIRYVGLEFLAAKANVIKPFGAGRRIDN